MSKAYLSAKAAANATRMMPAQLKMLPPMSDSRSRGFAWGGCGRWTTRLFALVFERLVEWAAAQHRLDAHPPLDGVEARRLRLHHALQVLDPRGELFQYFSRGLVFGHKSSRRG